MPLISKRCVIATSNPGKLRELAELLAPCGIAAEPQSAFGIEPPAETGATFLENALIKARHAARASGLPAIADDSGIEVDALGGAPGVHSARYAGDSATDEANLHKLLDALRDVSDTRRTARYQCVIVLVRAPDDPHPIVARGTWEGRLLREPRGTGGFGYDPIFEVPDLGLTAAELDSAAKNDLSHRGQALRSLLGQLRRGKRKT
jgi:XTP/dITP diphosphohydrolase